MIHEGAPPYAIVMQPAAVALSELPIERHRHGLAGDLLPCIEIGDTATRGGPFWFEKLTTSGM
jgi:hypothetical protein